MELGFILLPGAGMSDWLWVKLTPCLNLPTIPIARRLKVNNFENRLRAKFNEIVDYTDELIEAAAFDRVILVGHSGAGLLAGALGKKSKKIVHVVFIAANLPKNGNTALDIFPNEIKEKNIAAVKKQAEFDDLPVLSMEAMFRNYFCNTCTPEEVDYVLSQKFFPEPVCVLTEKMDWSDYPAIGKTYIICAKDKTLAVEQQVHLAGSLEISDLRRIDSDHLVMISHPKELANELNQIGALYRQE